MYWKEWLQTLLGLVILLGVLEMLLPSGELAKFAKLVLGLALMLAILQPLIILLNQEMHSVDLSWISGSSSEPEIKMLAERVQLVAATPFLRQDEVKITTELEQVLQSLDGVEDVRVDLGSSGQRSRLIYVFLRPFTLESARMAGQIVASVLNIPQEQVSVDRWPQ